MPFSEISKNEAVRLIEAKIKGEEVCYSSIVNEAVRMIKEEREKVERYEKALNKIVYGSFGGYSGSHEHELIQDFAKKVLNG